MKKLFLVLLLVVTPVFGSESVITEPDGEAYQFVSHYRVTIGASPDAVWSHLVHLDSWMVDLEMNPVSGEPGKPGQVLRLYEGLDFMVQITQAVPGELLVLANLPSTFKGERSTGVVVITLNESAGTTLVDLSMSRRYQWLEQGENELEAMRRSAEFQQQTAGNWNRFLQELMVLAEASPQ